MEQKLKIQVPEGCTAKIEQQDGFLVVVFEQEKEEKWEPNDGDICVSKENTIFIFNGNGIYRTSIHFALFTNGNTIYEGALNLNNTEGYRYATDAEKQRLFDALAKEGKRWNAETKRIEDLPRWRAKDGEKYYFVSDCMDVDFNSEDSDKYDDSYYEAGNYFKTEEAASRAAEKIRKILKDSEAE